MNESNIVWHYENFPDIQFIVYEKTQQIQNIKKKLKI